MSENAAVLTNETELVNNNSGALTEAEQASASAAAAQPAKDGEDEPDQHGKEGGYQRIKRQRDEARAREEYWRDRAQNTGAAPKAQPAAVAAEVEAPEPKSADFATTEEYLTAVRAWDRKQIAKEIKADLSKTEQQRNAEKQQKERIDAHFQREQQFAEANPQYHEKVGKSVIQISAAMKEAILESENGPAMALYLAEHPEEADVIREMPPLTAARAMGKIEASLAKQETVAEGAENLPTPPPISKAPPPINPVRKTGPVTHDVKPDDPASDKSLSDKEWYAKRQAQKHKR